MCKFCEVYNFKHVGIDFGIYRGDRPGIYLCGGLGEAPPEERFRFCPWCGEKLKTDKDPSKEETQ